MKIKTKTQPITNQDIKKLTGWETTGRYYVQAKGGPSGMLAVASDADAGKVTANLDQVDVGKVDTIMACSLVILSEPGSEDSHVKQQAIVRGVIACLEKLLDEPAGDTTQLLN